LFGLPKKTEINKLLPKKAIFDKFMPSTSERKLFDEQISRLAIFSEISPQTVSIAPSNDFSMVYIISVILKVYDFDKRNLILLSKLIDQRMLFALQFENKLRFGAYYAERMLFSENKPVNAWKLNLNGHDMKTVWENLVAEIAGIKIVSGRSLDEIILGNERRDKLINQLNKMEMKAMKENQPRRKWQYAEEITRLKVELEELDYGKVENADTEHR